MSSGIDFGSYNAPAAYGAPPAPSYNAPAPSYNAPAPSYNAPAPSYNAPAPAPSYNSNSPSSSLAIPNSGAYLTSKEDDQVWIGRMSKPVFVHWANSQINLEYISQINSELDQLRRIRDLLQAGGGRLSLVENDEIIIHPSPRIDVSDTWNGLPGLWATEESPLNSDETKMCNITVFIIVSCSVIFIQ